MKLIVLRAVIRNCFLVFGKKAQLSGIMVNEKHSSIFKNASTLEAAWDSNLIDMFRSSSILKIKN